MKIHDHLGKLRQVVEGIGDSLVKVVVIPFCTDSPQQLANIKLEGKEVWAQAFISRHDVGPLTYEQVGIDFFFVNS